MLAKTGLTQTRTLYLTFATTILMTFGFLAIMWIWDFEVIDEIWSVEKLKIHLASLTPIQKSVHAWTTGTLDVLYPFAYSAFFIGMTLRFFGRYGPLLAIPSFLVIPVDLLEGLIQIMLLNGNHNVIEWKAIVTPIKLLLFLWGLGVALIAAGIAGYTKWYKLRDARTDG